MGQSGATIWLTGLRGSGRWALAYALERRLFDEGRTATVVDPTGNDLSGVASACKAATDAGFLAICAYPTYKRQERSTLVERVGEERVLHVYVNTDEAICRERRPNVSTEGFEAPLTPDVTVALDRMRLSDAVKFIIEQLEVSGQFERPKG